MLAQHSLLPLLHIKSTQLEKTKYFIYFYCDAVTENTMRLSLRLAPTLIVHLFKYLQYSGPFLTDEFEICEPHWAVGAVQPVTCSSSSNIIKTMLHCTQIHQSLLCCISENLAAQGIFALEFSEPVVIHRTCRYHVNYGCLKINQNWNCKDYSFKKAFSSMNELHFLYTNRLLLCISCITMQAGWESFNKLSGKLGWII